MNDTRSVEDWMNLIALKEEPNVFQVCVWRRDYSDYFEAEAVLRGTSRAITAKAESPEQALELLNQLLDALICPVCGRLIEST